MRLRAAEALVDLKTDMARVFQQVIETRDRYGFHAYLTALENANLRPELESSIKAGTMEAENKSLLLAALEKGALPNQHPVRQTDMPRDVALIS